MKSYLVEATDRQGKRDVFERVSTSVEHLRNLLEREQFTDIRMLDDDVSAALRAQRPVEARPANAATRRLEARLQRGPDERAVLLTALRNNALLLLALLAGAIYAFAAGHPVWGATALALIAAWVWSFRRSGAAADAYTQLLQSMARGDLPNASRLIEQLRPQAASNPQLAQDLAFREAQLLVLDGQVEAARSLVAPLQAEMASIPGMYEGRLAMFDYLAQDYAGFIASMESMWKHSGAPLARLDLAFSHARVGDVARARELFASVDPTNLTELHAAIATTVQGICDLRDGEYANAAAHLDRAIAGLEPFATNAAVWPVHGIVAGFAALAWARAGRVEEARRLRERWRAEIDFNLDAPTRSLIAAEVDA